MTRKRLATITAIVGIMIVILTGAGKCNADNSNQPNDGSGGTTKGSLHKACNTVIVEQPTWKPRENLIEAKTHSDCKRIPDSHVVTITLWYHPYPNGNVQPKFRAMGNSNSGAFPGQNAYPGCGVTPKPGDPTDCIIAKRGICHVGIWKITVLVTGSMEGHDFGGPGNPDFKLSNSEEKHVHIDHCAPILKP